MCRIAGIFNPELSVDALEHRVKAMCQVQRHGGPDDEGFFIDSSYNLGLGHRRLSLIDLTPGGHQPMRYHGGDLVISYNGELYNFRELKDDLVRLGYSFTSHSDTEVILAAFAAWGTKAFKRFSGMFAFALFDKTNSKLYLVRDPAGIKPLYYSLKNNNLAFASEVRAFYETPEEIEENKDWPVYFLAYGHLPEPVTTLKHVHPLYKGSFLEYNLATRTFQHVRYTNFSIIEKLDDRQDVLDKIRTHLYTSVKRHLISDAPIGAFLSGGIDSSLIALVAGSYAKSNLSTLSIFFGEESYSEKKYQDVVVQGLQCQHTGYLLEESEFNISLPQVLSSMDLPSCDGINTWFISKYAKVKGLKAVLSGLGGDELFGGYPSFERMNVASYLQRLPNNYLRAGRYSGLKQFRRLPFLSLRGTKGKYLFLRGHFIPSEIARHLDMDEGQVWELLEEEPVLPDIHHLSYKNQASWMEMHLYMQNQLLRDSDVMSMAHGVEIRVPFLDTEFIKLALQITSNVKYQGKGKQLLIDAFSDLLPEQVYNRPKMGFAFPFKEWLANNTWVKDQVTSASKESARTYRLFLNGQCHWSQVVTLLLTQQNKLEKKAVISYA